MTRSTSARSSSSLSRPMRKASIGDVPSICAETHAAIMTCQCRSWTGLRTGNRTGRPNSLDPIRQGLGFTHDLRRRLPCGRDIGILHHPTVAGHVDRGLAFIGRVPAESTNRRGAGPRNQPTRWQGGERTHGYLAFASDVTASDRVRAEAVKHMSDRRSYAVVPYPPPVGLRAKLLLSLHRALEAGLRFERRLEPFFRRGLNRAFREPLAALLQYLINRGRPNEGLGLAEERIDPDEPESLASITAAFGGYMERAYRPGTFERGGNTKTHGIVRAEVIVRDDLPAHLRHGVFATPRSFPAFVRFSGPRPQSASGHCRCRFRQHDDEAHGCPWAEVDGRRKVHPGLPDRVHAEFCHAEHARERQAAGTGAFARCRCSISSIRSILTCLISSCRAYGTRRCTIPWAPATGAVFPTFSVRGRR